MGLKGDNVEEHRCSADGDKIRPKWDWKFREVTGAELGARAIKSDQNGIESPFLF